MKVSVIIAVYKDTEALGLIFEALQFQTYKNFEVIVAEDGESKEIAKCVDDARLQYDFEIKHTTQEDDGIQKSKSQNNAIRVANGEYLVFIDGDCIPYSTFLYGHMAVAKEGFFTGGRRVNLGPKYSSLLRKRILTPLQLEKEFLKRFFDILKDSQERHIEEGFYISPDSFLYRYFFMKRAKKLELVGCNFGCFKKDIIEINGFDEDLQDAAVASDTDIQWRLEAIGLRVISCKFIANQFHLFHKRSDEQERAYPEFFLSKKRNNCFRAINGIYKL